MTKQVIDRTFVIGGLGDQLTITKHEDGTATVFSLIIGDDHDHSISWTLTKDDIGWLIRVLNEE